MSHVEIVSRSWGETARRREPAGNFMPEIDKKMTIAIDKVPSILYNINISVKELTINKNNLLWIWKPQRIINIIIW